MTNNPNGIGSSIARVLTGSAVTVRWMPDLRVTVDGAAADGVQSVEFHPAGANGNSSTQYLAFIFQGSQTSARSARVSRVVSGVTIATTGDGFTATMTAVA